MLLAPPDAASCPASDPSRCCEAFWWACADLADCRSSGTPAVPAMNLVSVASRWYPSESSPPQGACAERGTLSRRCTSMAHPQRKRYKYLAQFGVASHLSSTISLTSHPRHYLVLPCLLSPTACPLSLLLCSYHRQLVKSIFACFSTSLVRPRRLCRPREPVLPPAGLLLATTITR